MADSKLLPYAGVEEQLCNLMHATAASLSSMVQVSQAVVKQLSVQAPALQLNAVWKMALREEVMRILPMRSAE